MVLEKGKNRIRLFIKPICSYFKCSDAVTKYKSSKEAIFYIDNDSFLPPHITIKIFTMYGIGTTNLVSISGPVCGPYCVSEMVSNSDLGKQISVSVYFA